MLLTSIRPSRSVVLGLRRLGTRCPRLVHYFPAAKIMRVHFRANEWGKTTCGSVATTCRYGKIFIVLCLFKHIHPTSHTGKSLYFSINTFVRVGVSFFVIVRWLSVPTYPFAPNRMVVRVTLGDDRMQSRYGCVLPIEDIEPTPVYVLPQPDGIHFSLMREHGYDRVQVV